MKQSTPSLNTHLHAPLSSLALGHRGVSACAACSDARPDSEHCRNDGHLLAPHLTLSMQTDYLAHVAAVATAPTPSATNQIVTRAKVYICSTGCRSNLTISSIRCIYARLARETNVVRLTHQPSIPKPSSKILNGSRCIVPSRCITGKHCSLRCVGIA
jgi:hypothetical protein